MPLLPILKRLRTLLGPLWWYSALLFGVSRMGDLINLYAGIFLVPAYVPGDQLGAVRPLLLLAALVATPIAWLVLPAEKFLNVFTERGERGKAKALLRDVLVATLVLSLGIAAVLTAYPDPWIERLKLQDRNLLGLVAVLAALACLRPVLVAATRSFRLFDAVVLSGLPGPFVRCLALWALLRFWPLKGYLAAHALADVVGLLVLVVALSRHARSSGPSASYRSHLPEMARYALPLLAYDLATRIQAPVEALVVRQRLPEFASAADYLIQSLAMIPAYFGDAVAMFFFPLVSSRHEQGRPTSRLLGQAMGVSALLGLGCAAALAVTGPWLLSLRPDWRIALPFATLVGWSALAKALRMALNCFILHEHACRRFAYLRHYVPIQFLQTGGLYLLMGWALFKGHLPDGIWQTVDAWPRQTLGFVVAWSVAWQGLALLAVLLDLAWRARRPASTSAPPPQGPA